MHYVLLASLGLRDNFQYFRGTLVTDRFLATLRSDT